MSELTPLSVSRGRKVHTPFIWALLLLALIGYTIPWLVSPGASLSPNAHDLAEWASLPPAARTSHPSLVTSLLLRLPLVCIVLIMPPDDSPTYARRFRLLLVVSVAIAALPPLEFFTQASNDPNYRQQFMLSLVTLIGGLVGFSTIGRRSRRPIILLSAFVGAAACMIGLVQGYSLLLQFGLPAQPGLGGGVLAFVFLTLAMLEIKRSQASDA